MSSIPRNFISLSKSERDFLNMDPSDVMSLANDAAEVPTLNSDEIRDVLRAYLLVTALILGLLAMVFLYWRFVFTTGKRLLFGRSPSSNRLVGTRLFLSGAEVASDDEDDGEQVTNAEFYAPLDAATV